MRNNCEVSASDADGVSLWRNVNRLRRAALLAFCTHLIAGLGMAFVLSSGWRRIRFSRTASPSSSIIAHCGRSVGSPGPLPLCDFVLLLDIRRYACGFPFRSVVDCRSPRPDLAAQSIEIGVLAGLAAAPEQFLIMHRVAVMLSGYLANGLYSATAIMLAWAARDKYQCGCRFLVSPLDCLGLHFPSPRCWILPRACSGRTCSLCQPFCFGWPLWRISPRRAVIHVLRETVKVCFSANYDQNAKRTSA